MPNVLSPRDLVSRPDNVDETVLSSIANHYETLIYGRLRAPGTSHAMALRYCEIDKMKARLINKIIIWKAQGVPQ